MKLYGIPNCDTVKKARKFLEAHDIAYEFHDFKKQGVDNTLLTRWLKQLGWQKLLKKTGPTWGKLPDDVKNSVNSDAAARQLMLEQPNLIKRPVLERDNKLLFAGFDEAEYKKLFNL
jgi:arsenate reductase (glutaredoxin)